MTKAQEDDKIARAASRAAMELNGEKARREKEQAAAKHKAAEDQRKSDDAAAKAASLAAINLGNGRTPRPA